MVLKDDLKEILKSFQINTNEISSEPVPGGTANRNYFILTDESKYVLRERSVKYSSKEQILFEYEYLKRLKYMNIPAPLPFLTADGACFTAFKDRVWQLFSCLPGEDLDQGNSLNVALGGRFLAELHNSLKEFTPKIDRILPRYDDPAVCIREIRKVISANPDSGNEIRNILFVAEKLQEKFPDEVYNQLPKTYIHGDYHPANVKMHNGEISGIFDFDWVSLQPRLRDVSDGIIYFGSLRGKNIQSNNIYSLASGYVFDLDRSRIFVDSFLEKSEEKIEFDEWKYIVYFIKARLIHSRVQALAKIPREDHVLMLTTGMREILSDVSRFTEDILKFI